MIIDGFTDTVNVDFIIESEFGYMEAEEGLDVVLN